LGFCDVIAAARMTAESQTLYTRNGGWACCAQQILQGLA
jgi:hypothetical protein